MTQTKKIANTKVSNKLLHREKYQGQREIRKEELERKKRLRGMHLLAKTSCVSRGADFALVRASLAPKPTLKAGASGPEE